MYLVLSAFTSRLISLHQLKKLTLLLTVVRQFISRYIADVSWTTGITFFM